MPSGKISNNCGKVAALREAVTEIWSLVTGGRDSRCGGQLGGGRSYPCSLSPSGKCGDASHSLGATPPPFQAYLDPCKWSKWGNTQGRPLLADSHGTWEADLGRYVLALCLNCFKVTDISLRLRTLRCCCFWWPPRSSDIDQIRSLRKTPGSRQEKGGWMGGGGVWKANL